MLVDEYVDLDPDCRLKCRLVVHRLCDSGDGAAVLKMRSQCQCVRCRSAVRRAALATAPVPTSDDAHHGVDSERRRGDDSDGADTHGRR